MKKNNNKTNKELLVEEWFAKANEDILSAEAILNTKEGAASTICFLAQQIAEKYLKGYLVYSRSPFPKIHYLVKLITLCAKIDSDFLELKEDAAYLSDFYVTTRYPGDYPTFGFTDAKKAFTTAMRIKDFVFDKINGKL